MNSNESIKLRKIGQYVLKERLGKGSVGEVWLSHHPGLNISVAVKILDPELAEEDEEYVERFMQEGQLASRISQRNLVRIYDAGKTAQGEYFIVMEYIEGKDALQLLDEKGSLPVNTVVNIAFSVCNALIEAHDHDIIHRDIKPDNIMITTEGKVKLADLGLAKKLNSDYDRTIANSSIGTPNYMSPEQAVCTKDTDERSDIYSLGATLYALATGTPPFIGETPMSVMLQHVNSPLETPQKRNTALPADLCDMICKMMAKNKEDRFQNCHELMEAIYPLHMKYSTNVEKTGKLRSIDFDKPKTQISLPAQTKSPKVEKTKSKPLRTLVILIVISLSCLVFLLFKKLNSVQNINETNAQTVKEKPAEKAEVKEVSDKPENETAAESPEAKNASFINILPQMVYNSSDRVSVKEDSVTISAGEKQFIVKLDENLSNFKLKFSYRFTSGKSHFALTLLRDLANKQSMNFLVLPKSKARSTGSIAKTAYDKTVNGEAVPADTFYEAKHDFQHPDGEYNKLFLSCNDGILKLFLNENKICTVKTPLKAGSLVISFPAESGVEISALRLARGE